MSKLRYRRSHRFPVWTASVRQRDDVGRVFTVFIGRYTDRSYEPRGLGDICIWTNGVYTPAECDHRLGDLRFFRPPRAKHCTDFRILPISSSNLTPIEKLMATDVYNVIPREMLVAIVGDAIPLPITDDILD
jgi:hypothetical protein